MIPPVVQPGDEFQRIRMPNDAGASGKSLRVVSVSGNLAQFEWIDGVAMEDLQAALPAPLAVEEGRVYTVPENQQVAFRFPIAVDGVLRVDGILYEV